MEEIILSYYFKNMIIYLTLQLGYGLGRPPIQIIPKIVAQNRKLEKREVDPGP
jgi:hypothetical protein